MEDNQEMSNLAKETLEVLKYFDLDFVSKISDNFLKQLEELAKNSKLVVNVDKNKELKDQNISDECKDLISIMYYRYVASEEEKREITNIWKNNEIKYQEKLKQKYNPNEIFKNNEIQKEKNVEEQKLPTVIEKENIIEKIRTFFKNLFRKWKN